MPPFVPRKRNRSPSPKPVEPPRKRAATTTRKSKASVFQAADTTPTTSRTISENKALLEKLVGGSDTSSSSSEADSDDFEDVDLPKRKEHTENAGADSDDEMVWEDALESSGKAGALPSRVREFKDLEITLGEPGNEVSDAAAVLGKKGPSRKERFVRWQTHCLHVQCLLYHNFLRNVWINDKEVQSILVDGLSPMIKLEVDRYKRAMGMETGQDVETGLKKNGKTSSRGAKAQSSNKKQASSTPKEKKEKHRDWGSDALRLEPGTPNLSRGDPLFRLLKYLSAYWKKRFTITAPGLRKHGYYPPSLMAEEIQSFRKDPHDPTRHGERIKNLEEFRELARKCQGSRDVGAQLFTALIRGLGIEARLVASLQPLGFGWNKAEDAQPRKNRGVSNGVDATPSKLNENGDKKGIRVTAKVSGSESELSSEPEGLSDDSLIDITPLKRLKKPIAKKHIDGDLPFPIFWTEILSPVTNTYIPCSPLVISTTASNSDHLVAFEPRGKYADKAKQVIAYIVAYSQDATAKDVTVRYLKRRQMPGKTKGVRLPAEKVPVFTKRGKIKKYEQYDWFKVVMRSYTRSAEKRTLADQIEDEGDLVPFRPEPKSNAIEKGEESLQGYKSSAEYVLERHLRREEAILPTAKIVKHFTTGKGDNAKSEPVYLRKDVVACKTVESWHKEGREVKEGEQPLKLVPIRAVTLIRKREIEEQLRESGEKPLQGLYSWKQTDWIIPEPIKDGRIPRNAFGNIDVYVPSMVPKGAVHVPLKGTGKLCKRLGIDYAEACTGFEFGKQRAVPVLTGVVVAEEHKALVREAWAEEQEQKRIKEEGKREKAALAMWRKFMMGLRIIERVREEYGQGGDIADELNPFTNKNRRGGKGGPTAKGRKDDIVQTGGGFLVDSDHESHGMQNGHVDHETFANLHDPEESDIGGGGFIVENDDRQSNSYNHLANGMSAGPISLQAAHADVSDKATQLDTDNDGLDTHLSPSDTAASIPSQAPSTKSKKAKKPPRKATTLANKPTNSRSKKPQQRTGKESVILDSASSSELSSLESDHSSDESGWKPSIARASASSARVQPKRQAARSGRTATKSHYFEQESGNETGGSSAKALASRRRKTR